MIWAKRQVVLVMMPFERGEKLDLFEIIVARIAGDAAAPACWSELALRF
jgi:hypothetical protein